MLSDHPRGLDNLSGRRCAGVSNMHSRSQLTVFLVGSRDMIDRLHSVLRPMTAISQLIAIDHDPRDTPPSQAAPLQDAHASSQSGQVALALIMTDTALTRYELLDLCKTRSKTFLDHRLSRVLRVGTTAEDGIQVSPNCDPKDLRVVVALLATNLRLRRCLRKKRSLMRSLHSIAVRDPLTGLANRRGWNIRIKRLWEKALEEVSFLMVALFDLDGFKIINDQLGHAFGDQVLKSVARKMQSACRKEDLLARWGGDEIALAVVLPERTIAQRLVDRVRSQLESRFPETAQPVTASAGYVVVQPISAWKPELSEELLRAADAALNKAKSSRDRRICEGTVNL